MEYMKKFILQFTKLIEKKLHELSYNKKYILYLR